MSQGPTVRKASASSKTQNRKSGAHLPPDKPYHHGSLPQALLDAAEIVLRRDGVRGLTLRGIAREAGVSHTASQHHFGDMSGVLSELVASGHRRLASAMTMAAEGIAQVLARRKAIARAYVTFATENPDLFRLMSRNELLDATRPSLLEARQNSARALADIHGVSTTLVDKNVYGRLNVKEAVAMTAAWAYIHGLASLLIDGRLNLLAKATDGMRDAEALVLSAIEHVRLIQTGQNTNDSHR